MKSDFPQELIGSDVENSFPIELETSSIATKDDLAGLNDLAFNSDNEIPLWGDNFFLTSEPVPNIDVATLDESSFFSAPGNTAFEENVPFSFADEGISGEPGLQNVGYDSFVKREGRFSRD